MKRFLKLTTVSLIALGVYSSGVSADQAVDEYSSPGPTPMTENGISYMSGGVGDDELKQINSAAKDYDLKLTFATAKRGEFLADVNVEIQDLKGNKVLDATSDGPIFLADLPKGTYKIKAESGDKTLEKKVVISGKKQVNSTFTWREQPVKAFGND